MGRFIFQNKSSETFPAYGCGRLKSILSTDEATGNPVFELVKPDGADGIYVINGPNNIAVDALGVALSLGEAAVVLIDDGVYSTAPTFGQTCGPTDNRWAITTSGSGLRATGISANRTIPVTSEPASSGAPKIRFTILSTAFTVGLGALGCDHVIVLVEHVSCGGTGVSVGDEEEVYDPEYCHFNLPIELLVGLSGTATLMKSENYQESLAYPLECVTLLRERGCMWMIDTLCCSEEELING